MIQQKRLVVRTGGMAKAMPPAAATQPRPLHRQTIDNPNFARQVAQTNYKTFGQILVSQSGSKDFTVSFPENSSFMLGLAFIPQPGGTLPTGTATFTVNNENIITTVPCGFLDITGRNFEFFNYPRAIPLNSTVKIVVTDSAVTTFGLMIAYLPVQP